MDRTASKTTSGTDGKKTDYTYLGLSEEVLGEEVAGELTKSYQYSPWGQRLSQVSHQADTEAGVEAGETGYYGYNAHTDVETVTDDTGKTVATYGYTAYGENDEAEFTGIDKPEAGNLEGPAEESFNAYRFNGKRWDASSGTYDMGFRDYNPGLNTFTTRDMYNGALADLGLGTDPFTSNRYAFGAGNPISMIEIDGHIAWDGENERPDLTRPALDAGTNDSDIKVLNPEATDASTWDPDVPEYIPNEQDAWRYEWALKIMHEAYEDNPDNYGRSNSVVAQMDVTGRTGSRTVVILNVGGKIPGGQDTLDALSEKGIFAITGTDKSSGRKGKGHSEAIAADLREDGEAQRDVLGGEITEVYSAVSSNTICSEACGEDLGEFLGKGFALPKNSTGYLLDHVITRENRLLWAPVAGTTRGLGVAFRQFQLSTVPGGRR